MGVAPRIVVTTTETTLHTHCHPDSDSSHESLFVDAHDNNRDFKLSNLNSDGKTTILNSNYDSIDTSESTHQEEEEEMESGSTSSETDITVGPPELHLRKRYSSSSPFRKSAKRTLSLDSGIVFGARPEREERASPLSSGVGGGEGERQPRALPSFLNQILDRVHTHPTRVGLWRLQKGGRGHYFS